MDVSTLSLYDIVTIPAHFYYLHDEKFGCDAKIKKYFSRTKNLQSAKKLVSEENGCGVCKDINRYEIDGIGYKQCLCDYRNKNMSFFLWLHGQYENGVLPFKGSLLEQPNYIIEVFDKLDYLKADYQAQQAKNI